MGLSELYILATQDIAGTVRIEQIALIFGVSMFSNIRKLWVLLVWVLDYIFYLVGYFNLQYSHILYFDFFHMKKVQLQSKTAKIDIKLVEILYGKDK